MSKDKDWRLRLDLGESVDLDGFLGRVRNPSEKFEDDARSALSDDVVLTHDGSTIFAYTAKGNSIESARKAIESVLGHEQRKATIRVSHWDETLRRWHQTDPPLTPAEEEEQARAADRADAERISGTDAKPETRPVVCVIGKLIRKSFEQQMVNFAQSIGLQCEIVEHPHLLSTQVAFKVTGRPSDVDEFARYLKNEARASSRMDMGLVPFGLP